MRLFPHRNTEIIVGMDKSNPLLTKPLVWYIYTFRLRLTIRKNCLVGNGDVD